MIGDEVDFAPPNGEQLFGITFDGRTLTGFTQEGRIITFYGTMSSLSIVYDNNDDVPTTMSGRFEGICEPDDFTYPVEVHFTDTWGIIIEQPRILSATLLLVDVCSSHVALIDENGCTIICVRDPYAPWQPEDGILVGRIGATLYTL